MMYGILKCFYILECVHCSVSIVFIFYFFSIHFCINQIMHRICDVAGRFYVLFRIVYVLVVVVVVVYFLHPNWLSNANESIRGGDPRISHDKLTKCRCRGVFFFCWTYRVPEYQTTDVSHLFCEKIIICVQMLNWHLLESRDSFVVFTY